MMNLYDERKYLLTVITRLSDEDILNLGLKRVMPPYVASRGHDSNRKENLIVPVETVIGSKTTLLSRRFLASVATRHLLSKTEVVVYKDGNDNNYALNNLGTEIRPSFRYKTVKCEMCGKKMRRSVKQQREKKTDKNFCASCQRKYANQQRWHPEEYGNG